MISVFGAQLYEAWTDPTPAALIEGRAPRLLDWLHRMLWPRAEGEFEPWSRLEPTLFPLLEQQVGRGSSCRGRVANAAAIAAGSESFDVELAGQRWTQKPQKYHAKSLGALRAKYAATRRRCRPRRVARARGLSAPRYAADR